MPDLIYKPPPREVIDFTQEREPENRDLLLIEAHELASFSYDMICEILELRSPK